MADIKIGKLDYLTDRVEYFKVYMVEWMLKRGGALTVTNDLDAGYGKFAPIELVEEVNFDELFNVLVKGASFTVQQIMPIINEGGSLILNTSIVTETGSQNISIYSAAKSAVQSFIKTFAAEWGQKSFHLFVSRPAIFEYPLRLLV